MEIYQYLRSTGKSEVNPAFLLAYIIVKINFYENNLSCGIVINLWRKAPDLSTGDKMYTIN